MMTKKQAEEAFRALDHYDREGYFDFLDLLRESGAINMYDAPSELAEGCEIDPKLAIEVVAEWMRTFNERQKFLRGDEDDDE